MWRFFVFGAHDALASRLCLLRCSIFHQALFASPESSSEVSVFLSYVALAASLARLCRAHGRSAIGLSACRSTPVCAAEP